MKFIKDDFDTSILKQDVYKLFIDGVHDLEEGKKHLQTIVNGIIFAFTPVESQCITLFEEREFHLISLRSRYRYIPGEIEEAILPLDCSVTEFSSEQSIDERAIKDLAFLIGKENRYFKDPNIPSQKSLEIYMQWIKNSLYKGFATKCFIAWHKTIPVGICTVRQKDDVGEVDLFGVLPEFQKKRIGKYMLQQAIKFLETQNKRTISVVIAGENIAAANFFERNRFILHQMDLVYHKHFI